VYNNPHIPPPALPSNTLKQLLEICTTATPFQFIGSTYRQINGVSMGSPLGPTFADFYMSHLENQLLSENNKISNPRFYRRYVDDYIAIFTKKQHVNWFKIRLGRKSVLNFTHEEMVNSKFHFLDINLEIADNGNFLTSIYVKPTDTGLYANYQSYLPDNYKKSVIKTLIRRALKYS
jgi:hypothetical protein